MVVQITSSQSIRSKTLMSRIPQRVSFSNFFKRPTFRSLHNVKYENFDRQATLQLHSLSSADLSNKRTTSQKGGKDLALVSFSI